MAGWVMKWVVVDGWGGVVLSSISYSVETLLVPVTGFLHSIINRRSRHLWSVSKLFLFFLVPLSFSFSIYIFLSLYICIHICFGK